MQVITLLSNIWHVPLVKKSYNINYRMTFSTKQLCHRLNVTVSDTDINTGAKLDE